MSKSISKTQGFEDEVVDEPKLALKVKKLHNQKQNLLIVYLNTNSRYNYFYNNNDVIATNPEC